MKAVILAGGTGTRLWPLSRKNKPKQFQSLASNKTLFQEAVSRLNFLKSEDIYIATNAEFVKEVKKQAPMIPIKNIIVEPALRDTASCIGLAAAVIAKEHPNEVMAVIYADHLIKDQIKFKKKLRAAEKLAHEENTLNIIEVKAKFPNVNLGYVRIGKMLRMIDDQEVYSFEKFIEKPDLKTAKKFLQSYKYLWNTGIYVWKVETILNEYKKNLPDTYKKLMKMQNALGTPKEKAVIGKEYPTCEKISIDYAIMEKVDPTEVRIIPSNLGWSDIGTWQSLHDEVAKNPTANITKGNEMHFNTEGSIIYNSEDKKLVVAVGLKDMAIINTKDAILICDKHHSQDIKKVVEALKKKGRDDLL
ncbi:MAG: sugar phosphate nucleotidyltransferase [Candidatus Peregrinibacteria bacterium]|nr:sugar phosphate nucleotidyltransferase [Candidatus Peregrinibacteria bacterium]